MLKQDNIHADDDMWTQSAQVSGTQGRQMGTFIPRIRALVAWPLRTGISTTEVQWLYWLRHAHQILKIKISSFYGTEIMKHVEKPVLETLS